MDDINHFQGKVIQYNSYFASNKWKARLRLFPYVAVVVLGSSLDAAKRQRLADVRIQRIIAEVEGQQWTQNYNWLFARLDQAQQGNFHMLTAKSSSSSKLGGKGPKLNLFNVPVN